MNTLTIALLQLPNSTNIENNTARALQALVMCEREGANLIVFPECFLTGFTAKLDPCTPEDLEPSLEAIELAAAGLGVCVLLPSARMSAEGRVENMGWWLGGLARHAFYKAGLTDSELRFFAKPEHPGARIFEVCGHRVGLILCREVADPIEDYIEAPEQLDCLVWPAYFKWDEAFVWSGDEGDGLMAGAYALVERLGIPLLQANYSGNDETTIRATGPDGRSVVIARDNTLALLGAASTPSAILVEVSREGCNDLVRCEEIVWRDGGPRPSGAEMF